VAVVNPVLRTRALPALHTLEHSWRNNPSVAWLRGGEGFLGWGIAAREHFSGEERFSRAQRWAQEQLGDARIHDSMGPHRTAPMAFASFTFDDDSEGSVVVIPRTVLGLRNGMSWRTDLILPGDQEDEWHGGESGYEDLLTESVPEMPVARWHDQEADAAQWRSAVFESVKRITAGELDKVVLARHVEVSFDTELPLVPVLARLSEQFPECWTFHIDGLIGATPELLVQRCRDRVASRVLAGSAAANANRTDNDQAANDLLASAKDLAEHTYAVRSVAHALAIHCTDMHVPASPRVLQLPNVQHLATDIRGYLADGASALALAASLHPTAAVCGTPTERARGVIEEMEQTDRGRYSGPVGWFDTNGDGEFAIALRCAQISDSGTEARLLAGCGLVADSDANAEYAESEIKLDAMRRVLDP